MTEKEYVIEMLCSLPEDLLISRKQKKSNIPKWLELIDDKDVEDACLVYNDEKYVKIRKEQEKYI